MQLNEEIVDILEIISKRKLGYAIKKIENFCYKYPELNAFHEIEKLAGDYNLMSSYWSRGYKDPYLDEQYDSMLKRASSLASNIALRYNLSHNSFLQLVNRRVSQAANKWTVDSLYDELESFVTNLAVLDLEPEIVRNNKKTDVYKKHQDLLSEVFEYIWISCQWTDGTYEIFSRILLSPTIDTIAQQLIVSAITLSVMNIYDIRKFKLLVDIYKLSNDEHVRQRALVGWILSICNEKHIFYQEQKKIIKELLGNKTVCDELVELQMQLIYCANAENDNNTIQTEIMPDILKHNNFSITLNGIEEKEDDPMSDILDPSASERNMEKVEEGFRKMIDMQKEGRDIYFGGFSQMKRYPFFDNISNWFIPFYENHPAFSGIQDKLSGTKILSRMLSDGVFCNSDKYSFLFAFIQIVDKLPKKVTEMLMHGEIPEHAILNKEEIQTSTYIRRIYLQDLYRFLKIYPQRVLFYNPFNYRKDENWNSDYVFFSNKLFSGSQLEDYLCNVAAFMLKRKMYSEASDVLAGCTALENDYNYNMFCGNILLQKNNVILNSYFNNLKASSFFEQALKINPDSEKALSGLARALFYDSDYQQAGNIYKQLLEMQPDSKSLMLNYCICLANLAEYDEALNKLYRLHYDFPDNQNICRVLARCLVGAYKYNQASILYEKMICNKSDILNYGYCAWFGGNVQLACDKFVEYLKEQIPNSISSFMLYEKAYDEIIKSEEDFIKDHGITAIDMLMMVDIICEAF